MKTDSEAIFEIENAFASYVRPQRFTDYWHCEECFEHNDTLAKHTPETITLEELGNPGWDPICFATPEAFKYYFPALSRLVLTDITENYMMQFLFHLNDDRRYKCFSAIERQCVFRFLSHINDTHLNEVEANCVDSDLAAALLKYNAS